MSEARAAFERRCFTLALVGAPVATALYLADWGPCASWSTLGSLTLLCPLVTAPLGLGLCFGDDDPPLIRRLQSIASFAAPIGAASALATLSLEVGPRALLASSAWVAFTWLIGAVGALRLLGVVRALRERFDVPELCLGVAQVFLAASAVWFASWRAGFALLGYDPPLVLLTSMHFQFAGFAAPLLASCTGRWLAAHAPARIPSWRVAAVLICAGPPIVAAGFLTARLVEVIGALCITASLTTSGVVQARSVIPRLRSRGAMAPMALSSVMVFATMALACVYAWSRLRGEEIISIHSMVRWHGAGNALGFGLAGMVAWALERRAAWASA